jgi:hypothetical protein
MPTIGDGVYTIVGGILTLAITKGTEMYMAYTNRKAQELQVVTTATKSESEQIFAQLKESLQILGDENKVLRAQRDAETMAKNALQNQVFELQPKASRNHEIARRLTALESDNDALRSRLDQLMQTRRKGGVRWYDKPGVLEEMIEGATVRSKAISDMQAQERVPSANESNVPQQPAEGKTVPLQGATNEST